MKGPASRRSVSMVRRLPDPADCIDFEFEGARLEARAGDSVAAALLANGVLVFRTTPVTRAARGPLCSCTRASLRTSTSPSRHRSSTSGTNGNTDSARRGTNGEARAKRECWWRETVRASSARRPRWIPVVSRRWKQRADWGRSIPDGAMRSPGRTETLSIGTDASGSFWTSPSSRMRRCCAHRILWSWCAAAEPE